MDVCKKKQTRARPITVDESAVSQSKKLKLQEHGHEGKSQTDFHFLSAFDIYIVKAGIEKARLEIFNKQIKHYGGNIIEDYHDINPSHIIVDDKMDVTRLLRLLNLNHFPRNTVVKSAWLSMCFKHKKLVELGDYEVKPPDIVNDKSEEIDAKVDASSDMHIAKPSSKSSDDQSNQVNNSKIQVVEAKTMSHNSGKSSSKPFVYQSDSDYEPSDDDDKSGTIPLTSASDPSNSRNKSAMNVNSWICAQSSKNTKPNCNSHITNKLEEMVKAYESTNDKWRAFGYQKAIQALRRHPKEISSWEEAKALPGVGGRLADKIWEIAESGELRKLNEFKSNEEVNVMQMFTDVWGAGPHTAQLWYQQGFRSIKDLQEKAKLTHQQKVGVRLYDDLIERMPREEAGQIEQVVREAAESLLPGVIAQACGSYRRGKATCGDVDVLVTHPDGRSHKGIFAKLLSKLKENGFLTDDLVTAEDSGNQKKYLGVCKLPGDGTKHRRLDIIVVPYDEYGCALVYFTGSAHFNRSLRHLCKKQNMSLNEHALKTGVVRKGTEKIHEGTIIPTPKEEDVFRALKVPFRPPEERDH